MRKLENKVAIVTGAARGMGAADARRLISEGAKVVLADVLDEEGRSLAKEFGELALYVHLDVRQEDDWAKAVEAAIGSFGRLDILVNNAGVQRMGSIMEMPIEDFRLLHDIHVIGQLLGMRAAIPKMLQNGSGSIINIASTNGLFGAPGLSAYTAAKHAVIGLTKSAAMELATTGIRVNAVCPGAIDTPMAAQVNEIVGFDASSAFAKKVPMRRNGRPDEIAGVVAFLASDDSSYCTGGVFVADGGLTVGITLD